MESRTTLGLAFVPSSFPHRHWSNRSEPIEALRRPTEAEVHRRSQTIPLMRKEKQVRSEPWVHSIYLQYETHRFH